MSIFQSKKKQRELYEKLIKLTLIGAATISILTTFGILFSILFEAIEFFKVRSFWYFMTGTVWSPGVIDSQFGALPIFAGTFIITIIALSVAIPVGLGSAIYMSEYASSKLRDYLKPILEVLAGIPSVVYGFFAAITVAPFVVQVAQVFGIEATFNSALASGIVMGIMIIPTISSLSDDVIRSVPDSQRKAAIVIPTAMPGIISASLLALSKALGETMVVVMAAGLRPNLSWNPLEDMTTVTVTIVNALVGDFEFSSPETLSAFALGLVLFVVTLILNMISLSLIRKFKEKYKVNTL